LNASETQLKMYTAKTTGTKYKPIKILKGHNPPAVARHLKIMDLQPIQNLLLAQY